MSNRGNSISTRHMPPHSCVFPTQGLLNVGRGPHFECPGPSHYFTTVRVAGETTLEKNSQEEPFLILPTGKKQLFWFFPTLGRTILVLSQPLEEPFWFFPPHGRTTLVPLWFFPSHGRTILDLPTPWKNHFSSSHPVKEPFWFFSSLSLIHI